MQEGSVEAHLVEVRDEDLRGKGVVEKENAGDSEVCCDGTARKCGGDQGR